MIRAVNWNPRASTPLPAAVKALASLRFDFTAALTATNPFLQQVAWVRCAPAATPAAPASTLPPVLNLRGTASISGSILTWKLTDTPALVTSALASGGLILIDLDCDYLADSTGAIVSGSAAVAAGLKPPVGIGGIFRSWIQVAAG